MSDAAAFQEVGDFLGLFDGGSPDEDGPSSFAKFLDLLGGGGPLGLFGHVDEVLVVDAFVFTVGGNGYDFEFVDLGKLFRFGSGGTGHSAELGVHAEVVLERDGGVSCGFGLNSHAFLGFKCLMQAIGESSAFHESAGKFVDEDNFAVTDYILAVA